MINSIKKEINKIIRSMKKYERPDILSVYDNKMKEAIKNVLKIKEIVILHDKIEKYINQVDKTNINSY